MPKVPKIVCETCEYSVIVSGETDWPTADAQATTHLEENTTHVLVVKTVWEDGD